jgi:hypothetical protein
MGMAMVQHGESLARHGHGPRLGDHGGSPLRIRVGFRVKGEAAFGEGDSQYPNRLRPDPVNREQLPLGQVRKILDGAIPGVLERTAGRIPGPLRPPVGRTLPGHRYGSVSSIWPLLAVTSLAA